MAQISKDYQSPAPDSWAGNSSRPSLLLICSALHEALEELTIIDPQQGRIVELKFFGGLSIEETAEVLGIGHATVERDWKMARAWLRRKLE